MTAFTPTIWLKKAMPTPTIRAGLTEGLKRSP
jgi:hypothetical protein